MHSLRVCLTENCKLHVKTCRLHFSFPLVYKTIAMMRTPHWGVRLTLVAWWFTLKENCHCKSSASPASCNIWLFPGFEHRLQGELVEIVCRYKLVHWHWQLSGYSISNTSKWRVSWHLLARETVAFAVRIRSLNSSHRATLEPRGKLKPRIKFEESMFK